MYSVKINNLDLKQIAESGQCFRFREKETGIWTMVAFGRYAEAKNEGNTLLLSCDEKEWNDIWCHYFDMETDYENIGMIISKVGDKHLQEAFIEGRGIRILRQDLWEMIVTFLISQNNNISRITGSVDKICRKAGKRVESFSSFGEALNDSLYRFPKPSDVEEDFFDDVSLGLGYRNEYLKEIYSFTRDNPLWLDELRNADYDKAKEMLLLRKGIGPKVAECICLFGLHHVEAFPIDTHVKQLISKYYDGCFEFEKYPDFAGIVQQYLFYYELKHK